MNRRNAIYLWAFAAFGASELLARALGIRFAAETLGTLYQYLDPSILRDDLAAGLYYLHAQPPLFNLGLGVVLKLFPGAYETAFAFLFGACALSLLVAMAWLMGRMGVPEAINAAVVLLFALSPNFLVYRHWLFYTLPVALLLVVVGITLVLYLETGRRFLLALFALVAFAVMMTRSVFHPLWLAAIVGALLPFANRIERRRIAVAALVPFLVVNLWFLKNRALVGSYSGSTWLGLSLAKRWPLSQSEVQELKAKGVLPPFWHRRPFQEPRELVRFGFFEGNEMVHPALDAPYKSNGEPNFNHRDYVTISEAMLEGNVNLIRSYPDRYLERVGTAILLYLQPGPNSVHFLVDYDFDRVHLYRDLVTRYLFFGGPIERPIRMLDPRPNVLVLGFPLLLAAGSLRVRRGSRELRALDAYVLVTVLWMTAVANLIEIGENDRMRWEVEPLLAVWLACLLGAIVRRLRTSARAGTA